MGEGAGSAHGPVFDAAFGDGLVGARGVEAAAVDGECHTHPTTHAHAIQGREQDALEFPGLDGTGFGVVQPVVFHHVMDDVTAAGWQIVQRDDGHLDVLLARPRNGSGQELTTKLQAASTAQGVIAPAVRIREVPAIHRTAGGKVPLIVSADRHTTAYPGTVDP